MATKETTTAKKDHQCCLCKGPIPAGSEYMRRQVTPWNSASDIFWTYKAHTACDALWQQVGSDCDWMIPTAADEFQEMTEHLRTGEGAA